MKPIGIIPDLQLPFELPQALDFMKAIKKKYKIPADRWVCIGDEIDNNSISFYDVDPDGQHTPKTELSLCIDRLQEWYKAFPKMMVCKSNHSKRIYDVARKAGLPSLVMRDLAEILQSPKGWVWERQWKLDDWIFQHGHESGGQIAARAKDACLFEDSNIAEGHRHSEAGETLFSTGNKTYRYITCGSLINDKEYAFRYNKAQKKRPILGTRVILGDGTTVFVEYKMIPGTNRWIGEL